MRGWKREAEPSRPDALIRIPLEHNVGNGADTVFYFTILVRRIPVRVGSYALDDLLTTENRVSTTRAVGGSETQA